MGKRIVLGVAGVLLFALIFIAGFGMAVQQLWNALMPAIFKLPRGFGHFGMRRHSGRWARMSAEERERLRAGVAAHRCGRRDDAGPGSAPAERVN
jgi:hypothetical protein